MHIGDRKIKGGRMGELSSEELSDSLAKEGLKIGRFKTGTPPRVDIRTINLDILEEQRRNRKIIKIFCKDKG